MNAIVNLHPESRRQESRIDVRPVAGRIGAVIEGVRLSGQLDRNTVEAIRQALHCYKVIFFRSQTQLDDAEQERFASLLGVPVTHPTVPARDGTRHIFELDSARGERANSWHTDVTFVDAPPYASVLRAEVVPSFGGDTAWANTAAAYLDLSPELRERAERLWAVHSNQYDYVDPSRHLNAVEIEGQERYRKVFSATHFEAEHPIVRVLPDSGERALILGGFTRSILGLSSADSTALFNVLQSHVIRLENTVRWRWSPGDVAIWDNRATQHYALNDFGDQRRIVRRVTLAGDVPVSVDGRRSVQRKANLDPASARAVA